VQDVGDGSTGAFGSDITGPADPRASFQPPFNLVSRERDPGRVNLNTVTGRRIVDADGIPRIWSEVYDGIMHRYRDGNLRSLTAPFDLLQYGHFGPAWRDVALSRKGYLQVNADGTGAAVEKPFPGSPPDTFQFGFNNDFPSIFANPFRAPDAGDLVPLQQMRHDGVDASWLRSHHYRRGPDNKWGVALDDPATSLDERDDDERRPANDVSILIDNIGEAGFGDDRLAFDSVFPAKLANGVEANTVPLFSETVPVPWNDGDRNPYMRYEPMSRLGNLVTTRSGVFAIWITVGYFEVEKAPDWNDPDVQARFGGNTADSRNLYNRVYPDGYMLGRELGSDTGDVKRPRGFYIIDRTEEVGFKPGEDLNVERTIRLRRRIE
jgi:hypothetical protein